MGSTRTELNICIWTFDQHTSSDGGSWECCHQWWVEFIIFIFLDESWQLSCHLIIKSYFDLQSDNQCWQQNLWIFIKVIVLGLMSNIIISCCIVLICKIYVSSLRLSCLVSLETASVSLFSAKGFWRNIIEKLPNIFVVYVFPLRHKLFGKVVSVDALLSLAQAGFFPKRAFRANVASCNVQSSCN